MSVSYGFDTVKHYFDACFFPGVCRASWTKIPNTQVLDGVINIALTVEACQTACFRNTSCTGVDWNPSSRDGQKCWLSGPWSGERRSRRGVSRYDISRTGVC